VDASTPRRSGAAHLFVSIRVRVACQRNLPRRELATVRQQKSPLRGKATWLRIQSLHGLWTPPTPVRRALLLQTQPKSFPKPLCLAKTANRTYPLPRASALPVLTVPARCRSCTSFASWAAQTKSSLKTTTQDKAGTRDCPADVETLGRSSWTLLHSLAATYPNNPTSDEQKDLRDFMRLFAKFYPCWVCAEDFQKYMLKERIQTGSRDDFGTWLCDAHNDVNKKLGKPTFDCSRWQERWRTGWKDGSCD
jgi:mitochondrial FAD-linked sulfhydryl oxidase